MKRIILLSLFLTYSYAHSETFNYTSIQSIEGFDGIFNLTNQNDENRKLRLDCQSFFHKLDFYNKQDQMLFENYISFGECEYLFDNFNKCLKNEKIKCVDTEDIFNESCQCD